MMEKLQEELKANPKRSADNQCDARTLPNKTQPY